MKNSVIVLVLLGVVLGGLLASCAKKPGNYALLSLAKLEKLARANDPKAQFQLGKSHELGLKTKVDLDQALTWYHKAAQLGHLDAQYRLGATYLKHRTARAGVEESYFWFLVAASNGHPRALESARQVQKYLGPRAISMVRARVTDWQGKRKGKTVFPEDDAGEGEYAGDGIDTTMYASGGGYYSRGDGDIPIPVFSEELATEDTPELPEQRAQALQIFGNYQATTSSSLQASDDELPPGFEPFEDAPVPIGGINPVYPDFAKRAGVQGTVVLEVEVFKDGRVGNVEVQRSVQSGPGGLDEAAIAAVKAARFQPGKMNGNPVNTLFILPIEFQLN
ncbi:MAG TPA: TonB family protein [Candidatus Syntrophosphaera sp.]|nr:TonB family protein [Candidatus Syntrophosphaera sp.]